MSDCAVPGRTLLLPAHYDVREYEGAIREEIGMDFRFEYSFEDVLSRYDVEDREPLHKFGPLPQVARVPEGEEGRAAYRLSRLKHFRASMPDFLVRPQGPITINDRAVDAAIAAGAASAGCGVEGEGCTIAILDTGVDGAILAQPRSLHPVQFDVIDPEDHGKPPADVAGHGSLIAHIINRIAPQARLVSIKTIHNHGSVSDVLAGLYLSQLVGPANLVNMSLSVTCQAQLCRVCRTPAEGVTNSAQLAQFFKVFRDSAPDCTIIAAAGNGYPHIAYPAALDGIIAVGAFDIAQNRPSALSGYRQVPSGRYVLAPSGSDEPTDALATKAGHSGPLALHGTSFAAAFVTGSAASFISCGKEHGTGLDQGGFAGVQRVLENASQRDWPGFDPSRHGMGRLAPRS